MAAHRTRRHDRGPPGGVSWRHALLALALQRRPADQRQSRRNRRERPVSGWNSEARGTPPAAAGRSPRRGSPWPSSTCGHDAARGPAAPGVGFRSEMIGLVDSATGLQGRSAWTDERGDQVFSELQGEGTAERNHITGTILGGTGRYAGATGSYEFSWQWVMETEDGSIQGRAVDLKGRVRPGPGGRLAQMSTGLRLKRATPFAIAIAIWFLPFRPGSPRRPGTCSRSSPRPSRRCCSARSRCSRPRCSPWALLCSPRRSRRHRPTGFRQLERAARGDCVHRRAGRGEVGARPADQLHGEPLWRLLARAAYSIVRHRRGHRAGLSPATRRGGVLFPIVLSVAKGAGSKPEDLKVGGWAAISCSARWRASRSLRALDDGHSANPIGVQIVQKAGLEIEFGKWLLASLVPSLIAIGLLPLLVAKLFPPRVARPPRPPLRRARNSPAWGRCRATSGSRPQPSC